MMAVNEIVMPVISYSFGVVDWLEGELKDMDVKIRKLLNMHGMMVATSDVDRIYTRRASGGRGLQSVWDSFQACICRLAHYICQSESEVMKICADVDSKALFSITKRAAKYSAKVTVKLPEQFDCYDLLKQARIVASQTRDGLLENRLQAWKVKPQHGAYLRQLDTKNLDPIMSIAWLNGCFLDPHTESYLCAAQELALFTRYHECHLLRLREDDLCRICRKEPESIYHLLAGCDCLAKREYFARHNSVCKYVHFTLMKEYAFPCAPNWYVHEPVEVVRSQNVEIIYDQFIATDRPIGANRPDILVRDKGNVYLGLMIKLIGP